VREIITNAYDAMRSEAEPAKRIVQVELKDGFLRVSDSGTGMGLDTILKKLFPPFEGSKNSEALAQLKNIIEKGGADIIPALQRAITQIETSPDYAELSDIEKLTLQDVKARLNEQAGDEASRLKVIENMLNFTGRFGIGFYSLLYFLKDEKDSIEVETSTGAEAYRIYFFRRGGQLETAIEVLNPAGAPKGTTVTLRQEGAAKSFDKNKAQEVMTQFLSFNSNAKISLSLDGAGPVVINAEVFNP